MNTPGQTLHSRCQPNRRPLREQQREFVRLRSRRPGPMTRAGRSGGARRDRADDLMLAKHALYQLSYGPKECVFWALSVVSCHRSAALHRRSGGPKVCTPKTVGSVVGPGRLELPTSRLSGVCSNQLSYRPLKRFALSQPIPTHKASRDRARRARDRTARPSRSAVCGKRNEDGGHSAPDIVFRRPNRS